MSDQADRLRQLVGRRAAATGHGAGRRAARPRARPRRHPGRRGPPDPCCSPAARGASGRRTSSSTWRSRWGRWDSGSWWSTPTSAWRTSTCCAGWRRGTTWATCWPGRCPGGRGDDGPGGIRIVPGADAIRTGGDPGRRARRGWSRSWASWNRSPTSCWWTPARASGRRDMLAAAADRW